MRRAVGGIVVWALLVLAPAAAQAQQVHWESALPPAPSPSGGLTEPACADPVACLDEVAGRLDVVRRAFGCDHRAVFATTYQLLTEKLRDVVLTVGFEDPSYVARESVKFFELYQAMLTGPDPEAWAIANATAASGDAQGAQDLLLGINAHVQRDMPFMMAAVGLRDADGRSRKPDHDLGNEVLMDAYEPVVREVGRKFDPQFDLFTPSWSPVDDMGAIELVRGWREGVWRNAERLLNASNDAERAQVAASIELNAATWARLIAAEPVGQPEHRAARDAHCAAAG